MTEKQVIQLLVNWKTEKDELVSMSRDEINILLSDLGCSSYESLNDLRIKKKYIDLVPSGSFVLTNLGQQIREVLLQKFRPAAVKTTSANWAGFRKLVAYYLECIKHEERSQDYIKPDKIGSEYFIPKKMDYDWLEKPSDKYERHTLTFDRKSYGMKAHLTGYNPDIEVRLGYPILAVFDAEKRVRSYIPVATVPVVYCLDTELITSSSDNAVEVYFDFDNATLNQEWIEKNIPDDSISSVDSALEQIYKKNNGKLDLQEALYTVLSFAEDFQSNVFNPNILEQSLPKTNHKKHGVLCNTAVIYKCANSRYSKNLIEDLEYIRSKATLEELDNSSLAFIYRDPVFENKLNSVSVPIPFISSNPEQLEAVEKALCNHVSKIQGPPGTGKSQVSVNLIANCVYNNKSVLFTSRNKAALTAIEDRANDLLDKDDMSLVNFCVRGEDTVSWWDLDYSEITEKIMAFLTHSQLADSSEFLNALNMLTVILENGQAFEKQKLENIKAEVELTNSSIMLNETIAKFGVDQEIKIKQLNDARKGLQKLIDAKQKGLKGLIARISTDKVKLANAENEINSLSEYVSMLLKNEDYASIYTVLKELEDQLLKYDNALNNVTNIKLDKYDEHDEDYLADYDILERDSKSALAKSIYDHALDVNEAELAEISTLSNILKKDKHAFDKFRKVERTKYLDTFKKIHQIQTGWSFTLLSLYRAAPMSSGIFDYVIIDEAAQCDCVSIIPALFRSKNAVLVGDEKQFKPIINLSRYKEKHYWETYVNEKRLLHFDYLSNSAYSVVQHVPETMLKEHFRCAEGIANYFNEAFYGGELRIRTEENGKLPIPKCLHTEEPFLWHDVRGGLQQEIDDAVETYLSIINSGYDGSIGIISPLRDVINEVYNRIYSLGYTLEPDCIGTTYSFQGGQKDIIIFIVGLNDEIKRGKKWYLTAEENKNIYNVAVSRAKACFVIIGNKELCKRSSLKELRQLTEFPKPRIRTIGFDSPNEKVLYEALLARGIDTQPQYPLFGYFLDLAYQDEYVKIDIEIDGKRYHQNMDGTRVRRDLMRDEQVKKHGWVPLRFWSSEITNNLAGCVDRIEAEISHARNKKY